MTETQHTEPIEIDKLEERVTKLERTVSNLLDELDIRFTGAREVMDDFIRLSASERAAGKLKPQHRVPTIPCRTVRI